MFIFCMAVHSREVKLKEVFRPGDLHIIFNKGKGLWALGDDKSMGSG